MRNGRGAGRPSFGGVAASGYRPFPGNGRAMTGQAPGSMVDASISAARRMLVDHGVAGLQAQKLAEWIGVKRGGLYQFADCDLSVGQLGRPVLVARGTSFLEGWRRYTPKAARPANVARQLIGADRKRHANSRMILGCLAARARPTFARPRPIGPCPGLPGVSQSETCNASVFHLQSYVQNILSLLRMNPPNRLKAKGNVRLRRGAGTCHFAAGESEVRRWNICRRDASRACATPSAAFLGRYRFVRVSAFRFRGPKSGP